AYRLVGFRDATNLRLGFFDTSQAAINTTNTFTDQFTTPVGCAYVRLTLSFTATQLGYGIEQYKQVVLLPLAATPGYKAYQYPFPYYVALTGESVIDGYLRTSVLSKDVVVRRG